MKHIVDTGLPPIGQPFSWAVKAGGLLFTTHGPVRGDGTLDTGPIERQTRLTLENIRTAVTAAGGQMSDVAQVLIYMTDEQYMPVIDRIYREFFEAPYPNRSSVAVRSLVAPGMRVEMVVYAAIAP
ncbi:MULTISPECIES: RidA family protein [Comamonas]|uniref:Reactive intermediate deaminase TdcF n=1 Tax=Comamonas testosteroni TaxID=285 RepID=A0A8B4S7I6_COMTE|nr:MULTISPECIES: RidA family protein [Comamonas]EHN66354.1 endoribonuclease L-PSP [Comamonas testosteroni ATCC 11996]QQN67920.1 RidA family protein [Comamonas testosteroni]RDI05518.1 enamine deaminase RidA (YjgF/YER057c/UK114 family) [Comamonas sp. AG1104]SUY78876.1 Putative reactive intermediate deaminase TdcF [Comamonas testosteroni]